MLAACGVAESAYADQLPQATAKNAATASAASSAMTSAMAEGEIKKVDKEAAKLTIKHGELKNLGMPPMTMIFLVKDKALLDQVKAGDKINFLADKENGKLVVKQLVPLR